MDQRPLWAPWRIAYITGAKDGECIFCAAAATSDDRGARIIERGGACFTMLNTCPYASGHVMVPPYRHVGDLDDLEDHESLGRVAGAGFADHLHQHVVPRWNGDTNFMPVLAGTPVMPQALDATRDALVEALADLG
jgi:ATP adenylyltransferase